MADSDASLLRLYETQVTHLLDTGTECVGIPPPQLNSVHEGDVSNKVIRGRSCEIAEKAHAIQEVLVCRNLRRKVGEVSRLQREGLTGVKDANSPPFCRCQISRALPQQPIVFRLRPQPVQPYERSYGKHTGEHSM